MAYVTVDSARSDDQLRRNIHQSADADLILVDSDRLERFAVSGKPVRRFAYAVNEWLHKPTDKVYDVAFLCWPTPERRNVQGWAEEICKRNGWLFLTGTYANPYDYAAALCTAKIVIHKQHVTDARSWRVFDVMAAMGCLLSNRYHRLTVTRSYRDGIITNTTALKNWNRSYRSYWRTTVGVKLLRLVMHTS